jgi:hypothetical protein
MSINTNPPATALSFTSLTVPQQAPQQNAKKNLTVLCLSIFRNINCRVGKEQCKHIHTEHVFKSWSNSDTKLICLHLLDHLKPLVQLDRCPDRPNCTRSHGIDQDFFMRIQNELGFYQFSAWLNCFVLTRKFSLEEMRQSGMNLNLNVLVWSGGHSELLPVGNQPFFYVTKEKYQELLGTRSALSKILAAQPVLSQAVVATPITQFAQSQAAGAMLPVSHPNVVYSQVQQTPSAMPQAPAFRRNPPLLTASTVTTVVQSIQSQTVAAHASAQGTTGTPLQAPLTVVKQVEVQSSKYLEQTGSYTVACFSLFNGKYLAGVECLHKTQTSMCSYVHEDRLFEDWNFTPPGTLLKYLPHDPPQNCGSPSCILEHRDKDFFMVIPRGVLALYRFSPVSGYYCMVRKYSLVEIKRLGLNLELSVVLWDGDPFTNSQIGNASFLRINKKKRRELHEKSLLRLMDYVLVYTEASYPQTQLTTQTHGKTPYPTSVQAAAGAGQSHPHLSSPAQLQGYSHLHGNRLNVPYPHTHSPTPVQTHAGAGQMHHRSAQFQTNGYPQRHQPSLSHPQATVVTPFQTANAALQLHQPLAPAVSTQAQGYPQGFQASLSYPQALVASTGTAEVTVTSMPALWKLPAQASNQQAGAAPPTPTPVQVPSLAGVVGAQPLQFSTPGVIQPQVQYWPPGSAVAYFPFGFLANGTQQALQPQVAENTQQRAHLEPQSQGNPLVHQSQVSQALPMPNQQATAVSNAVEISTSAMQALKLNSSSSATNDDVICTKGLDGGIILFKRSETGEYKIIFQELANGTSKKASGENVKLDETDNKHNDEINPPLVQVKSSDKGENDRVQPPAAGPSQVKQKGEELHRERAPAKAESTKPPQLAELPARDVAKLQAAGASPKKEEEGSGKERVELQARVLKANPQVVQTSKVNSVQPNQNKKTIVCKTEFYSKDSCDYRGCSFVHPSKDEKFAVITKLTIHNFKLTKCPNEEKQRRCLKFLSCTFSHPGEYVAQIDLATYGLYRFSPKLRKDVLISVYATKVISEQPGLKALMKQKNTK